jgi:tetratricopeptide (TPR) repeat protein
MRTAGAASKAQMKNLTLALLLVAPALALGGDCRPSQTPPALALGGTAVSPQAPPALALGGTAVSPQAPPALADEASQVELLKTVFARSPREWISILEGRRALLDDAFFQRVSARLQWDAAQGQWWDRRRFAVAGDLALRVIGKPPHFCAELEVGEGRPGWTAFPPGPESDMQVLLEELSSQAPASAHFPELARTARSLEAILKLESARQARQSHRYAQAERELRAALVADPKFVEAWLEIAELHFASAKVGMAAREFDQATRLDPNSARAWLGLGLSRQAEFQQNGEFTSWDRATLSFSRCLQLEPDSLPARSALAELDGQLAGLVVQQLRPEPEVDWQLWIPSREESCSLSQPTPGHWWRFNDDTLLNLDPSQTSGALLWRGIRDEALVWVRSRQPDTRLLLNGRLAAKLGDEAGLWTRLFGAPSAQFAKGRRRVLVFVTQAEDIGLEVEDGRAAGVILMEKGRLVRELRSLPGFKQANRL